MFEPEKFSSYALPEVYQRNGANCFLDPIRQKLILITPEEMVRQRTVRFLHEELAVPYEMMELEVPMSYFRKGAAGRADIIVYGTNESGLVPVLVVECKASHVALTDDVYDQVLSYDEVIMANTVMITNGQELFTFAWNDDEQTYSPLKSVPTYDELVSRQRLEFNPEQPSEWIRPTKDQLRSAEVMDEFMEMGVLGEDTPDSLRPFILDLACFLMDTSGKLLPQRTNGLNILSDGGLRYTTFGNAAGGSWEGSYRYFILEDGKGNHQIVSVTILGSLKSVNDPVFGTRKGRTMLIAAIDDYEASHNSIQLNLDKYTIADGDRFTIWHDGTLTKGKQGAARKSDVLDFVRARAPELMSDDRERIILGTFDYAKDLTWQDQSAIEFIIRLLKYALIRDEYRKLVR